MAHISFLDILHFIKVYRMRFYGIYSLRTQAISVIYPVVGVVLSFTAGLSIGFNNPIIALACAVNGGFLIVICAFVVITDVLGHI